MTYLRVTSYKETTFGRIDLVAAEGVNLDLLLVIKKFRDNHRWLAGVMVCLYRWTNHLNLWCPAGCSYPYPNRRIQTQGQVSGHADRLKQETNIEASKD
jgi:hypothetical protein